MNSGAIRASDLRAGHWRNISMRPSVVFIWVVIAGLKRSTGQRLRISRGSRTPTAMQPPASGSSSPFHDDLPLQRIVSCLLPERLACRQAGLSCSRREERRHQRSQTIRAVPPQRANPKVAMPVSIRSRRDWPTISVKAGRGETNCAGEYRQGLMTRWATVHRDRNGLARHDLSSARVTGPGLHANQGGQDASLRMVLHGGLSFKGTVSKQHFGSWRMAPDPHRVVPSCKGSADAFFTPAS